jgi:phosphate transport system substrate-binding protein
MVAQSSSPELESRFSEEARAAGITIPPPQRFGAEKLITAIAVVVLLVAASVLVGYRTNWLNPTDARSSGPQLAGPWDCGNAISPTSLSVAAQPNASSTLMPEFAAQSAAFANVSGRCLTVNISALGTPAFATLKADALIGAGPSDDAPAVLPYSVELVPVMDAPVVVIYNLGGAYPVLNLSAADLAGIYLGAIRDWNDPTLAADNPGLPSASPVTPVHLDGPSETNWLLSSYLSLTNASWKGTVGVSFDPRWSAGPGVSSPEEMLARVASTPGAIGYAPTNVCPTLPSGLACARLPDPSGGFVPVTASSISAGANLSFNLSAALAGDWANVSAVRSSAPGAYPLVEITSCELYRDLGTAYGSILTLTQSKWLLTLLWWVALDDSGSLGLRFGYSALPSGLAISAQQVVLGIAYHGTSVLGAGEESGEGNETGEF